MSDWKIAIHMTNLTSYEPHSISRVTAKQISETKSSLSRNIRGHFFLMHVLFGCLGMVLQGLRNLKWNHKSHKMPLWMAQKIIACYLLHILGSIVPRPKWLPCQRGTADSRICSSQSLRECRSKSYNHQFPKTVHPGDKDENQDINIISF